jgi:hypothetical protein
MVKMERGGSEATLAGLLEKDAVSFSTLENDYGALLQLVRALIGVVPNCDRYLEIWPAAFRTYNVMVPNFLNLPFLVWGLAGPREAVGLGMYVSSRAADCPYCSAHCCSFALRRGATASDVAASFENDEALSPELRAVAQVARALGSERAELGAADREALESRYSASDVESIVLGIAMMGWLNKMMNALGVPLELPTIQEVNGVIGKAGWTPREHFEGSFETGPAPPADSFGTKIGIVRYAPSAIALDKKWTAGVPDSWPKVGAFLKERTGHDFPILKQLRSKRAIRGLATMLRDNLVDRGDKLAAGLIYAEHVGSKPLLADLEALGAKPIADSPLNPLARALAPSPTMVDSAVVEATRNVPSAAIIETVAFVSLLQLLHRLYGFFTSRA